MPLRVQRASAGALIVRVEGGVRLGPLGQEEVAAVKRWLGDRATKQGEE